MNSVQCMKLIFRDFNMRIWSDGVALRSDTLIENDCEYIFIRKSLFMSESKIGPLVYLVC